MIPLDQRDGWIWLDGELVPWREARLHLLSHGLHYASAVFEGERTYGGRIYALEQHGDRLIRSCAIAELDCRYDARELDRAAEAVVAANRLSDGYVRRIVWRGAGVLAVGAPHNPSHAAIAAWPWAAAEGYGQRVRGLRLATASWRRPPPACMPHEAKIAAAYAIGTLSRHAAVREGFDDALLLDWRGQVAEASGANIFFVDGDHLVTPPADCMLDGITRRTLIRLAAARGIDTVERGVHPAELNRFGEAFLTGTAAEVTPVRAIDSVAFALGQMGALLAEAYQQEVHSKPAVAAAA